MASERPPSPSAPFLQVVRGDPSHEEIAALVAVLTARARAARAARERAAAPGSRSGWRDHARRLGVSRPGPDSWRRSFHPG
ncbi:acyl-CoA carboxylase subunit epsilon [Thermobifida cellulosilytica]|uniref:Acyl-CoA dehydrogenase n=1 Tax=Thermobifida cellulosilytica TB100 TaxID=665004 RepID=A0A147KG77_THECS|nr:acyl-CoA carboxylase subunit epsilon [Thermobifida cellulosilytica]KUP96268.1 acyl-CoA dehydrogenase [Thermobifida cellulosilytica TB100]